MKLMSRMLRAMTTPPILEMFILQDTGLLLFHRSFVGDDHPDPSMFAGLTAAFITFSKELGSEINSLKLQNYTFYLKRIDSIIFVFKLSENATTRIIDDVLARFFDDEEFVSTISAAMFSNVISPEMSDKLNEITTRILKEMRLIEKG